MTGKGRSPEFWSDYDGTGVHVVESRTGLSLQFVYPRNWMKWPLRGIDGYADFLAGVQDSGVTLAGVASRRQAWRRRVTVASMTSQGVHDLLPDLQLLKTESAKGKFIARRAFDGVVGMIEDKPDKLVPEVVQGMLGAAGHDLRLEGGGSNVVIGVVGHHKAEQRITRVGERLETKSSWVHQVTERPTGGLDIEGTSLTGHFGMIIVPLEPYSHESGAAFGELVMAQEPTHSQG